MSLPLFDAELHQVGLGPDGAEIGLVLSGAYQKSFKRDLGDSLSSVHYGTDSLFNGTGISSWTQDDFTGGSYQQFWGRDAAQFAGCYGFLPTQFDRSLRTVPPLTLRAANGAPYTMKPLVSFAAAGYHYSVYSDRILRYNMVSGASATIFLNVDFGAYTHACYDRRSGYVLATYVGGASPPGVAVLNRDTGVLVVGVEPGAANNVGMFTGINCDGDRLVVSSAHVLFTASMQPNTTDPIGTDWVRAGRLPAPYVDSAWMAQSLYVLCGDGDVGASLVQFDGVQVMPVCEFPYNFFPQAVCPYAGRIYVGGSGLDINGGSTYGELHEVTGNSVRLIKTFAPERASGRYGCPTAVGAMAVHEGLLFFGETGQGLIAYDVTTDSLYGAHRFDQNRPAGTREVLTMVSARQKLWQIVVNWSNTFENGLWATGVAGEGNVTHTALFESSEFGPELDRMKKWKQLRVLCRGEESAPTVAISTDGGASYANVPRTADEGTGSSVMHTYDISGYTSHSVRFKFAMVRNSFASNTELVGFSASFQLVDSDDLHANGTEKLAWNFAVAGVETVELEDGSTTHQKLGELNAQLWAWAQARAQLKFKAPDGQEYDVIVDSLRETQPVVLPAVEREDHLTFSPDVGREAFYALTLIEA